MARKKLVQCPACKFTNRFGDAKCLICKQALPTTEDAVVKEEAPRPAPPPPRAATPAPVPSAPPKRPAGPRDTVPQLRPPSGLLGNGGGAQRHIDATPGGVRVPEIGKGRPSSRLIAAEETLDKSKIVAWMCCEPLPPIPLGPKPMLTIGRQADCDLCLPHKEVSRRHAVVKVRGTTLVFEDEGSSNGSFLNGNRVSHSTMRVGDTLSLGPYEVTIRSNDDMNKQTEGKGDTSTNLELTSVSRLNPAAALTGKLQEMPLTELLQGIEFNKKSGTLTINAEGQKGVLVVADGMPQFATWGTVKDDEAVQQMLSLVKGRFTFNGQLEPGARTMRASITAMLLEASRRIDEGETAQAESGGSSVGEGREPEGLDVLEVGSSDADVSGEGAVDPVGEDTEAAVDRSAEHQVDEEPTEAVRRLDHHDPDATAPRGGVPADGWTDA